MPTARRFALLTLALLLVGCGGTARTVYVVRHAEKAVSADAPKDPPLTEQGTRRAAALAREIDVASLVAVYSTPYARTKSTAQPSTEWAELPVTEYAADDVAGLVGKIRGLKRGHVLVVGHSNTVPEIVKALGVAETVTLGDGDFGDLFVVTLAPDGTATMERRRFGDNATNEVLSITLSAGDGAEEPECSIFVENKTGKSIQFFSIGVEQFITGNWVSVRGDIECSCNAKCNKKGGETVVASNDSVTRIWDLKKNDCESVGPGIYRAIIRRQANTGKGLWRDLGPSVSNELQK